MFSTTQEILKSVRSLLNEAQPSFWTDEELIEYINEGMEDFCIRTKCIASYFYKTIEAEDLFDGREVRLPPGFVALAEGGVLYNRRPLPQISVRVLDEWDKGWRERDGEPQYFYLRHDYLGFYPKPSIGAEIGLFGFRLSDALGVVDTPLEGDVRVIPFRRYIRDYALSRAWEKKGDFQKAQLKRAEYEQGVLLAENLLASHKYQGITIIPSSEYRGRPW